MYPVYKSLGVKEECKDVKDFDLIKYHIIRLAKSEKLIEEKLDYLKVFRALITQPHTILEQTKKTIEDDLNLTVFVNINCNYYPQQYKSFPNSVLEVCKI